MKHYNKFRHICLVIIMIEHALDVKNCRGGQQTLYVDKKISALW